MIVSHEANHAAGDFGCQPNSVRPATGPIIGLEFGLTTLEQEIAQSGEAAPFSSDKTESVIMTHATNHDASASARQPIVICTALVCLTAGYAVRQYCAARERAEKLSLIARYGVSYDQQKLFKDIITKMLSPAATEGQKPSFWQRWSGDMPPVYSVRGICNVIKHLLFIIVGIKPSAVHSPDKFEDTDDKVFSGGAAGGHTESSLCCCGKHSLDDAGGCGNAAARDAGGCQK